MTTVRRLLDRTEVAISLRFIAVGTASLHFVSSASWAGVYDSNAVAMIENRMFHKNGGFYSACPPKLGERRRIRTTN